MGWVGTEKPNRAVGYARDETVHSQFFRFSYKVRLLAHQCCKAASGAVRVWQRDDGTDRKTAQAQPPVMLMKRTSFCGASMNS